MGAGHPGGSRPNGVRAVPILPDPPQPGRGPIISSIVALAPPAAPSPVILKFPDPDEARRRRGRAIAAACRIEQRKPGLWVVPAQTGGGSYWVRMDDSPPTCTCEDFAKRERDCKHIHAVRLLVEQRADPGGAEPLASPGAPDGPGPLALRKPM